MRRLLYISLLLLLALLPCRAAEPVDTIRLATMMENAQYDEVIALTTRELKRFPKSGAMYYYRCMASAYQGQLPSAIDDLTRAIRYHRDAPMALPDMYVLRAGLYTLLDDTVAALTDYTLAIQSAGKHPRHAGYYVRRARAYAYYEQYDHAADDYRSACRISPDNAELQLELARYLALSGQTAEARLLLEDLSTLHPEQIEAPYLLAVLLCYYLEDYNASVNWVITALTRRYLADRTLGEADILFMAGAIDYPYVYRALSDEITRYDAAEEYGLRDLFYLLRAELLRQRGYADDALADLDSVSPFSFPRKMEPALEQERIQLLVQLQRWQEVIDRTTPLIALSPDSSPYYPTRAAAYYGLEQYPAAEADLRRAFALDSSAHTAFLFSMLYQRQHRYAEEARYLSYTIDHTDSLYAHLTQAYLLRGEAYLRSRDTIAAYRDFHEVLRRDTDYYNTVRHYALYRLGRCEEALTWVRRLIQEYPEPGSYYDAACLYAQQGDTAQALCYLEIALRWGYSDPRQMLHDPDLAPLRSHPDFQALVDRYVPSLKPKNQNPKNQKSKTKNQK